MFDFPTMEVVEAKEDLKSEIRESELEGENTKEKHYFPLYFLSYRRKN